MFEELLRRYDELIHAVRQQEPGLQEDPVLARKKEVQAAMKQSFTASRDAMNPAWLTGIADFNTRIRLVEEQLLLTLGEEELGLMNNDLSRMLEQARALPADPDGLVQRITGHLRQVEQMRAELAAKRREVTLGKGRVATAGLVLPPEDAPLDAAADTNPILARQQVALLEMQVQAPIVNAKLAANEADALALLRESLGPLRLLHRATATALSDARRLAAAHAAVPGVAAQGQLCTGLGDRVAARQAALERAEAAAMPDAAAQCLPDLRLDAEALPRDVAAAAADIRKLIQRADSERRRAAEQARNEQAADAALDLWLTGQMDARTPDYVLRQLATARGQELMRIRGQAGSLAGVEAAIRRKFEDARNQMIEEGDRRQITAEAQALADMMNALRGTKMNALVQNYYHLTRTRVGQGDAARVQDRLTVPEDRAKEGRVPADDSSFLNATHSAQGDFNDPANLGKYTYQLTALSNILNKVRIPEAEVGTDRVTERLEGISVQGLLPGKGGQAGGSSALSDARVAFAGTDIKSASVVNSQNKVASASARQESMRTYIMQREQTVDELQAQAQRELTEAQQNATAEAAVKASSVMLRFPLRAEYLGKFDKDPVHLTANLALLDGTPVPPEDIEILVHHQWMPITSQAFQTSYRELFGLPPLG